MRGGSSIQMSWLFAHWVMWIDYHCSCSIRISANTKLKIQVDVPNSANSKMRTHILPAFWVWKIQEPHESRKHSTLLRIVYVCYVGSWLYELFLSHNSYNKEVAMYPGTDTTTILRYDILQPVDTFRWIAPRWRHYQCCEWTNDKRYFGLAYTSITFVFQFQIFSTSQSRRAWNNSSDSIYKMNQLYVSK